MDKYLMIYSMKSCPMCKKMKDLLTENNINFIDRDIHEHDEEYKYFVIETKNDYVPGFVFVTMENDEVSSTEYLVPDRDFQDIDEALDKVKEFILR